MIKVTVLQIAGLLDNSLNLLSESYSESCVLNSTKIKAVLESGFFDYEGMTASISHKATLLLDLVKEEDYKLYLLLKGPILDVERKSRIPHYSLSSSLSKRHMSLIASQEKIIEYPDGERVVGLYALEWKDFDKYVSFLTKNSWAIELYRREINLFQKKTLNICIILHNI